MKKFNFCQKLNFWVDQPRFIEKIPSAKSATLGTKYQSSYDLFAYRTATATEYVTELNSNPETNQWEADLIQWEFYASELDKEMTCSGFIEWIYADLSADTASAA